MPHPYSLPAEELKGFERTEVCTNLDELISLVTGLSVATPPGVWVASTDMLLISKDKHSESKLESLCCN